MARPTTNTVDYFSHDCQHKQTMYILESRYGNNGYAFWFKLLEVLGQTPNHFIDCNDDVTCEFLAAKTNLNWGFCDEILNLLAKLGAICPELWGKKIVWSQKFIDRLSSVYAKRKKETPCKPSFCDGNPSTTEVPATENPQSKVKERKEKNSTLLREKRKPAVNKIDDAFEKFWSIYPKKVEKKSAYKKFIGIIKRGEATEDQIVEGVKNYLKSDTVAKGFIKNPTTWLNGGCWNDEFQEQKEGQSNGSFDVMQLLKEK